MLGVVLNDGTPIKSVEVKVDDGPWQPATLDPSTKDKYGWKLFTYTWNGADAGRAHARVARDRRHGTRAADRRGAGEQEVVPRAQLAGAAQGDDRLAPFAFEDWTTTGQHSLTLGAGPRTVRRERRVSDRDAFDTESIAHMRSVYRTALRITGNPTDAEDLTQETYARALRASDTFRWGTNLKAWLLAILRNIDRNRRRDAARAPVIVDEQAVASSAGRDDASKTPESLLLRSVIDRDLQAALESLPRPLQEIIWLRDVEELSYAELAERLGIPLGTVMSRLSSARERLFRRLTSRPGRFRGRER